MSGLTMGSLFDGIGGFPLAAERYGITPVWASEIERFPIEVTSERFPSMTHRGDITKLNGKELFPVDIICGGSPCQDLSVAGARAGLAGARSGLFIGVEKDTLQAVIWFSKAEKQDNCYAAYALGKLYLTGEDVPKDMEKALHWLQRSADLENEYAQYRLGMLHLAGEDIPKDVSKAIELLTASAQQGNQYAQYQLGKLYLLGTEVEKDEDTAVRWLTLSAAQGNEYAQWFLDHCGEFRGPTPLQCATRLLHHMSQIFREQAPRPLVRVEIDRKLRQRIREKKIAMGHKPNDHEQRL